MPAMLTRSFIFAKGMTEDQERALWSRGLISWEVLRQQPGEAIDVLGNSRGRNWSKPWARPSKP